MRIALAMLAALSTSAQAADFSYSYFEATGDLSKTKNTAAAPLEDDADGELFGFSGSWEVLDPIYVKAAWSRETKDFSNEVLGTPLDLDSRQTLALLGAGYHLETDDRTSLYFEAFGILEFKVKHSIPLVTPSQFGPPSVAKTESVLKGDGYSLALGLRRRVGERFELEGQIARIHTSVDIRRTGAEISDSETLLRIDGRYHVGGGLSVGAYLAYSKHTDDNFNNIRKLGASLRYSF